MQLNKRVEKLEAKVAPNVCKIVHLVGVMPGQTDEEACAVYGRPIGAENDIIFLVGVSSADPELKQ